MTINKWNLIPLVVALGLVIAAFTKVAIDGSWSTYPYELLMVFGGFVAFVFSDVFSDFTGDYGWTRQQWRQDPVWYVRLCGGLMLVMSANRILGVV